MYKTARSTKFLSAFLISSLVIASCNAAGKQINKPKKSGCFTGVLKKGWPVIGMASSILVVFALKDGRANMKWLPLCTGITGCFLSLCGLVSSDSASANTNDQYYDAWSEKHDNKYFDFLDEQETERHHLSNIRPARVNVIHNHYYPNNPEKNDRSLDGNDGQVEEIETEPSKGKKSDPGKPFSPCLTEFWEDPLGW